jgi:hypothetical protein
MKMLTSFGPKLQLISYSLFNLYNMKTGILIAILISAVSVNAQSLKDALYSGKLKMDSNSVIHKTDNWTSKIDTSTRKPVPVAVEPGKTTVSTAPVTGDAATAGTTIKMDSAAAAPAAAKDNNKLWKDYIDEFTGTLRTDVLPSSKIKGGSYSVLIEYEIGTDGQVSVSNVSSVPESAYLTQQIKERITLGAPQMTPLLGVNGKPRKAVKKYTLTISK